VKWEITELSSPTALQRFGAPFRSDKGEVAPEDSELPILRYLFVHHVRNFPFLDQAKEKEFWQERLQVVSTALIKKLSSSRGKAEYGHYREEARIGGLITDILSVPRIIRYKTNFLLGRPSRRNETPEIGTEGTKGRGADDGVWHPYSFWL